MRAPGARQFVGGRRLAKSADDHRAGDMLGHALIAEIVEVEIVARHQLQIGAVLRDEAHRVVAAHISDVLRGGDPLQRVANGEIFAVAREARGILQADQHHVDLIVLQPADGRATVASNSSGATRTSASLVPSCQSRRSGFSTRHLALDALGGDRGDLARDAAIDDRRRRRRRARPRGSPRAAPDRSSPREEAPTPAVEEEPIARMRSRPRAQRRRHMRQLGGRGDVAGRRLAGRATAAAASWGWRSPARSRLATPAPSARPQRLSRILRAICFAIQRPMPPLPGNRRRK